MQSEQLEISSFLTRHPPFDTLPPEARDEMARQVEVSYFRAGGDILFLGQPIAALYLVRSGAVETFRRSGELYNRLSEGGIFGQLGLMMNHRVRFPVKALEDSLLYAIPAEIFHDYCDRFETFGDYFESEASSLLHRSVLSLRQGSDLISTEVGSLIQHQSVEVAPTITVRAAAEQMTQKQVPALLVVAQEGAERHLLGIITDYELRSRVLALGLPATTAVAEVMATHLPAIDTNDYLFSAMLTMLRENAHHLPVLQGGVPVAVLSLTDLVRQESQSSLLLVRSIFSQPDVDGLERLAQQLPAVFSRMVQADANSHMIGSAMAVIGRSFKQRLLELAEEAIGPPPLPYCFLALGSMARDEQLIYTDQDNALILDNSYNPEAHGDYFAQLAQWVSDGLDRCGYRYCSGGIMATNPSWRLTLNGWKEQFNRWIEEPDPRALLNSSIFFDLDGVAGEIAWGESLRRYIAGKTRDNGRFLACLARNALNRTPPLGFFKGFVLEKDGKHNHVINLKRRGTAPLTDVIRVHALAVGSDRVNSFERIEEIAGKKLLPQGKERDLRDALEFIAMVRIRHQVKEIAAGEEVDNSIDPEALSGFERRNLREAFEILSSAQNFLKYRYHAAMARNRKV
ncbi:MAG: cyclic nucleotide-binding/CBS domain-containing protein [Gammaproteobacteria bacterium]|nr:cyclic nucleotide-binding/CBS domain-containing protein [Gammaproteobacteria bacterium]